MLSLVSVAVADRWAVTAGLTETARTVAVLAANVGSLGALWIAQFVILDRVLFRARPDRRSGPRTMRSISL